jgi:hypothetical protein
MGEAELGATSRGVWTRGQALRVLSAEQVRSRLRSGRWQVPWPGVYADAGYDLDAEQRGFAAVLASGGADQPLPFGPVDPATGLRARRLRAVACGRTAARVWRLPLVDDDDPATGRHETDLEDVAGWHTSSVLRVGAREVRRHRLALASGEVGRTDSGLWITSRLRTLVDCTRLLPLEAAVCALDDALHRGLVTVEELRTALAQRRAHAWSTSLATALAAADGRAESPAETLTRLLLLPALPELEPQLELFDEQARLVARFDLASRRLRLAVETDGRRGHAGPDMVAKDRRRDARTQRHGWSTERVTWWDVRCRQQETRQRVLGAAQQREAQLRRN